jgi:hypothetical protein
MPYPFNLCGLTPKLRLQIQLKHRLNKTADVVTRHLAKCFVDLRRLGLAPERIPELKLDHVERGFGLAALVGGLFEA